MNLKFDIIAQCYDCSSISIDIEVRSRSSLENLIVAESAVISSSSSQLSLRRRVLTSYIVIIVQSSVVIDIRYRSKS